jgi:hypothetical protein
MKNEYKMSTASEKFNKSNEIYDFLLILRKKIEQTSRDFGILKLV